MVATSDMLIRRASGFLITPDDGRRNNRRVIQIEDAPPARLLMRFTYVPPRFVSPLFLSLSLFLPAVVCLSVCLSTDGRGWSHFVKTARANLAAESAAESPRQQVHPLCVSCSSTPPLSMEIENSRAPARSAFTHFAACWNCRLELWFQFAHASERKRWQVCSVRNGTGNDIFFQSEDEDCPLPLVFVKRNTKVLALPNRIIENNKNLRLSNCLFSKIERRDDTMARMMAAETGKTRSFVVGRTASNGRILWNQWRGSSPTDVHPDDLAL